MFVPDAGVRGVCLYARVLGAGSMSSDRGKVIRDHIRIQIRALEASAPTNWVNNLSLHKTDAQLIIVLHPSAYLLAPPMDRVSQWCGMVASATPILSKQKEHLMTIFWKCSFLMLQLGCVCLYARVRGTTSTNKRWSETIFG